MRLFQPMLYVGLGGTGCQVGIELERRLRDEMCGPDGAKLQRDGIDGLLPHQLPGFTQFLYADLNEVELSRVRRQVAVTEDRAVATGLTDHFAHNLVPQLMTYPEVARSLRANASPETLGWLPPPDGEPRVSPLVRGAGQLPTVGRAALFETFRSGLESISGPLNAALSNIAGSRPLLTKLGAKRPAETCNVFVCFSIAGGTGAGIFYDFLHLIGRQFAVAKIRPQIYPLVLMPSAFEDGFGGGRRADLNAAAALLDLFRLIDDQNARGATDSLQDSRRPVLLDTGTPGVTRYDGRAAASNGGRPAQQAVSVDYPTSGNTVLEPATVQTAFLFSKNVSIEKEDLHRSMVSFVLSLVGTELDTQSDLERASEQTYQSFADSFINQGVERQVPAFTGVGNRPVSTSLVASMTVPVDELADIISSRILARAVGELSAPSMGHAERNRQTVDQLFASSGLEELRVHAVEPFREPAPARGGDEIVRALRNRVKVMDSRLQDLPDRLAARVPELARDFDYRRGLREALARLDPFRVRRAVLGNPQAATGDDKLGFIGSLEARRSAPQAPTAGMSVTPPLVPPPPRRFPPRRVEWADRETRLIIETQDAWYKWRTESLWNAAWGEASPIWDSRVRRLRSEIIDFTEAFLDHMRADSEAFEKRIADLYRQRIGVSYLLPRRGDFEQFYDSVIRRFVTVSELPLRPNAGEAEIVAALLGTDGWRLAFDQAAEGSVERRYERAVSAVRDRIKERVKTLFTNHGPYGEDQPLLPQMRDLLAKAAGRDGVAVAEADVAAFEGSLAGLLPIAYAPEGTGQLKILVAYPADAKDPQVERYIEETVALPRESGAHKEFRAVDTESIIAVLMRTSMGITEVSEIRQILRRWADALVREEPQDFMRWRQRLSYDYRWLATTEADRVNIMHHLLCAMWNGQVTVVGPKRDSPYGIRVKLSDTQRLQMELRLDPYGRASSWSNLLRSYEEWTFGASGRITQDFCQQLMQNRPDGLAHGGSRPAELYTWFVDELVPAQVKVLEGLMRNAPADSWPWVRDLRDFWKFTVPAAITAPFQNIPQSLYGNLQAFREAADGWDDGPEQENGYGEGAFRTAEDLS
jgi:tubulin-like protein